MGHLPFDVAPSDPRNGNASRGALLSILQCLQLPPNYRVVLDVDRTTEKLQLVVLKRKVREFKLFGRVTVWRDVMSWDNVECEQRRIEGRTYAALIEQLRAMPEFLEFEVTVTGAFVAEPVVIF